MHQLKKIWTLGAFALATLGFGGAAQAAPATVLGDGFAHPYLVLVEDQENLAVEEDLRPDEMPEGATEGAMEAAPKEPMAEAEEAEDGDIEDKMIDEIGPGAE